MNAYKFVTLIVVSVLVSILLASALNNFTRVSDSALAQVSPPLSDGGGVRGGGSNVPRTAHGKNYLPIIFLNSANAGGAWLLAGNAGTNPANDFLGTTDKVTLTVRVSNTVAYRIIPAVDCCGNFVPNIIGGSGSNSVAPGIWGATIGGGGVSAYANVITGTGDYAFIGGGFGNTASGAWSTVGGGDSNKASNQYASIGGGGGNTAGGDDATIGGGNANNASDYAATVGGGNANNASGYAATVGGGELNTASDLDATVGGRYNNTASGQIATIGGGYRNAANNYAATIGGGDQNTSSGFEATIGGGYVNSASGNYSTIPGGWSNSASGDYSFAAGYRAKANNKGAFVWADDNPFDYSSPLSNTFHVRATNGVRFTVSIDGTGADVDYCRLTDSTGGWACVSDRNAKENLRAVDSRDLLQRLNAVPILNWNYRGSDAKVRHLGPMAQDFYAAFGLGNDDKTIGTMDAQGVAFAAIQELDRENQELKAQKAQQQTQIDSLNARLTALEQQSPASNMFAINNLPLWSIVGLLALWLVRKRKS